MYLRTVEEHRELFCTKKGEQECNLSKDEVTGLRSLQKRLKSGDIVIMKTDKSSKFAVTDQDNYLRLGEEHVSKDREIGRVEIREREKTLNSHSAMFIKMWNIGENSNHGQRVRDSKITHSSNVATMSLLLKDHKKDLKTRPVVSGNESNTVGLSNMASEVAESVANCKSDPYEVISTEDLLHRIHECNLMLEKNREDKLLAGEEITNGDKLVLIGYDAVALFPSLQSVRTGQIARNQVEKSEIIIEGADYMEMCRYAVVNRDKITGELGSLERLLPRRRKSGWKVPGMQNPEIKGKAKNTQITWVFPDATPTELEKRRLHGIVVEIVIRTLFENFVYTFGGKNYLQLEGGPIGCRITMAVSRLVMQEWADQYRVILERASLNIWLYGMVVTLMTGDRGHLS